MQVSPWIIVQAGGLGTRMKHLTTHRPKCLVPVGGQTIISNVVNVFGGDKVIVIGDHLIDVLRNYVSIFHPNVKVVKATSKGTCGGLKDAVSLIDDDNPVIFMWSDLFFEKMPEIDYSKTTIGLSRTFPCRYQYDDALYSKVKDARSGVAGFFCFPNSKFLSDAPDEGSFVGDYLRGSSFNFDQHIWLDDVSEIGTLESLNEYESRKTKSRFFNEVTITSETVTKKAKDERFVHLIKNESRWYSKVNSIIGIDEVPKVINDEPFQIEYRKGIHPYKLSLNERKKSLTSISSFLSKLHKHETSKSDENDMRQMYLQKTLDRTVRFETLIHGFDRKTVKINGIDCSNPLHSRSTIEEAYKKIKCDEFCLIHGDLTFSNCLWDSSSDKLSVFDPRGVFGSSVLVGDPAYDWAKVYYSSVDRYDITNTRDFEITKISDNEWIIPNFDESMDDLFWSLCPFDKEQIMIRLSFIWFSLIGYLENDIDSMNLSFLKGCLAFNKSGVSSE